MAAAELSPRTQREGEGMRGSPAPFSADEDTILRRYAETRDPSFQRAFCPWRGRWPFAIAVPRNRSTTWCRSPASVW